MNNLDKLRSFFGGFLFLLTLIAIVSDLSFFNTTPPLRRLVCTTDTGIIISRWVPYAEIHKTLGGGTAYDKQQYNFMLFDNTATCEMEMQ